MVYIGSFLLILCAFYIWRLFCSYLDGELACLRSVLFALTDYRDKMRCYLMTPREWASSYKDELLEGCGMLTRLRDGEDFASAYNGVQADMTLSDGARTIIEPCFAKLGDGYAETELAMLDMTVSRLTEEEKRESEQLSKRRKAIGAIVGACTSGLVIIMI